MNPWTLRHLWRHVDDNNVDFNADSPPVQLGELSCLIAAV